MYDLDSRPAQPTLKHTIAMRSNVARKEVPADAAPTKLAGRRRLQGSGNVRKLVRQGWRHKDELVVSFVARWERALLTQHPGLALRSFFGAGFHPLTIDAGTHKRKDRLKAAPSVPRAWDVQPINPSMARGMRARKLPTQPERSWGRQRTGIELACKWEYLRLSAHRARRVDK
jgi:hypothetical protein